MERIFAILLPEIAGDRAVVTIFLVFWWLRIVLPCCTLEMTTFTLPSLFPEREVVHSWRPLWRLMVAAKAEGLTLDHQFWEGFFGRDLTLSCSYALFSPSVLIATSMFMLLRRAMKSAPERSLTLDLRVGDGGRLLPLLSFYLFHSLVEPWFVRTIQQTLDGLSWSLNGSARNISTRLDWLSQRLEWEYSDDLNKPWQSISTTCLELLGISQQALDKISWCLASWYCSDYLDKDCWIGWRVFPLDMID